ncbi:DUF1570 domain-containing protein [Roseiconus nitratireducens]|uniref:DUF1570 domain-containing protein n=1 Tax=Roseiconus nitratireducens TaxID=2605748 RepID=UPI0028F44210|nr:DUF1570 domain-containing protein [Roseiconus nitratireducens]
MPSAVLCAALFGVIVLTDPAPISAVETVTFKSDETDLVNGVPRPTRTVTGEILVEAQDGGLMLQSDDGRIWTIQPEQVTDRKTTDRSLQPLSDEEMADRMMQELPNSFSVFRTGHYVIVHNTNDDYVRQVGALFEQLYKNFYAFWKNQGWKLPEPRFPLVALVMANREDFLKHASAEVGDQTAQMVIGYYHLSSNRMTMFNMPNLERNIATIIHEATHQLAYNCGVQRRFADNPMWVSEGLAMYFESPDFKSALNWRGIGRVNQVNLKRWRDYLPRRPEDSLATLLSNDQRLQNSESASDAYAESWALTYFLIRTQREEYVKYLKQLSEGKPMAEQSARERIKLFESTFEKPLGELDQRFVHYMNRVR